MALAFAFDFVFFLGFVLIDHLHNINTHKIEKRFKLFCNWQYFFLALAADEQGLSCWRLDVMQRTIPAFHFHQFRDARDSLVQNRLLAFKSWSQNAPDGVYQLLALPPKQHNNDLQTQLANVIKPVS